MFIMGYWAMGNTAIFESKAETRVFFNRSADPQHKLIALDCVNQSHYALLIFLIWFVREFIYDLIYINCILKCKNFIFGYLEPSEETLADLQFDEKLPKFWQALSGDFQKKWYTTELYNQK